MSLTLIIPPAIEPVSVAEVRAQCRIDDSTEDALLAIYIQAARQHAEGLLFSALVTQTWEQTLDAFPAEEIKLLKPPVLGVTSVAYIDASGAVVTLPEASYVLDAATGPGWLFPASGTSWPSTSAVINAVRIRFTAGFGPSATDVPAPIRQWLLLTIAYLHAQRESHDLAGKVTAIPNRFVDSLLDPYRQYGL